MKSKSIKAKLLKEMSTLSDANKILKQMVKDPCFFGLPASDIKNIEQTIDIIDRQLGSYECYIDDLDQE